MLYHQAQSDGLFDELSYLVGPTRSSRAPDWTSDPTDNFGIISLAPSVGRD